MLLTKLMNGDFTAANGRFRITKNRDTNKGVYGYRVTDTQKMDYSGQYHYVVAHRASTLKTVRNALDRYLRDEAK